MRVKLPFFLCLSAVALASAAGAMPRVPGPELQVNQLSTLVEQRHPMAAYAPNGTSLVVWEDVQTGLKGRLLGRDIRVVGHRARNELIERGRPEQRPPFTGQIDTRLKPLRFAADHVGGRGGLGQVAGGVTLSGGRRRGMEIRTDGATRQ